MRMNNRGLTSRNQLEPKFISSCMYVCLSHFITDVSHTLAIPSSCPNFGIICFLQDFGVHGIAPRAVATKEEFSQSTQQGTKRAASDVLHTVIPGASALQSLVVPAHSTIGAKLLKALGWREGEGLGPKVMKYGPQQGGLSVQCNNYYCLSASNHYKVHPTNLFYNGLLVFYFRKANVRLLPSW